MDRVGCDYNDCTVLMAALRNWTTSRYGLADRARIRAEIRQLIKLVEAIGPRDVAFQTHLDAARALVVLERPTDALDHVEALLSAGRRTGRRTRPGWR
jgi:hypothetical protein